MRMHAFGFSLIECMVTITLLLIIITLVSVNFAFVQKSMVRSDVDALYMACMYLQRVAQMTQKTQYLKFDLANNCYYFEGQCVHLSQGVKFGCIPEVKGPPAAPRYVLTEPITFDKNAITYMPHGFVKPGTVYITDTKKTILYAISAPIADYSYLRRYGYEHEKWKVII